ncbi:FIST C-terminal domain-containing protein [Methylotenera sp.]|uniref:FIST C-terminal domain-containing protein n=1 Tax=Methylotenera sp. TaxID=2051956 RepID=UPI002716A8C2|nr:FIST C-terminal domain-containing protein [Methylotenera sp.]MDO9206356.1 FIST C-terminal domain-containing protein [Methylotenera sp.]
MKVATSILLGNKATPALVAEAVAKAMLKADISIANSVLLLLTTEFADNPQPAIKAAAKAANCTQVFGCSATGIFTEEDWVLDSPAVAVMVFGGDVSIHSAKFNHTQQALLTLTAPNAINSTWLNDGNARYGGVSGDALGQGPFSVWKNAKADSTGRIEAFFTGVKLATKASHGLKLLTKPKKIQHINGYDIELLDNKSPFAALQKAWESHRKSNANIKSDTTLPSHLVMAVYASSAEVIHKGEYEQANLISVDESTGSITLAQTLEVGQYLCWGLRDQATAEADLVLTTQSLTKELGAKADFGLLFSCIGRGPFYDGIDHDLKVITQQLPNMPLLGFYGNSEIATIGGKNQLLPYSAVLSLFSELATLNLK